MMVWSLFIIGLMGLFFYNKIGSIIPMVVLPTTEIIEPEKKPSGWATTVQPLIFDRNNCKTQWLIGIFVRFLSFKDGLCGRKQFFLYLQPPTVSQTVGAMRGWED